MDLLNRIPKTKALRAQSIVWKKAKARDAEESKGLKEREKQFYEKHYRALCLCF